MLYRVLRGKIPFKSESSISTMLRRVQEEASDVRQERSEIPRWLAAIIARMLKRDPEQRYQSMAEVQRDLERRTATLSWRQVLRPRLVLPVAALIVVLAVVAAAVTLAPRFLSSGEDIVYSTWDVLGGHAVVQGAGQLAQTEAGEPARA